MKVHTNYLNAVILFALAFLLAAATGPVAAQQPVSPDSVEAGIPPQVHQLIDLLDDPAVRTWMDQQRAARNPPQTTPVDPQATLSTFTAARVALVRQHLQSLIAALPNLPGEFRQTSSVLLGELRDWGLITVVLLTTGFALLGVGLEWLFWHATARVRTRLHDSKLDTIPQRLRGVTTRFAIGLGQVIAFALGSIGAFLPFEWPPLLRNIVLGYLVAFLFLRLSLVIGRFLLAPKVERFRIIPVTTPQARFWYLRLALFVGWFAFGYITVEQFSLLGASREARQILAYTLGLGLLGIGLESIWRNPHVSERPTKPHQHLAALRLLRRTLAPVGRGSHAALLACDGRGRPSHGDQADATLGQPHPPPTRRSRPAASPIRPPPRPPLPPAFWPSAWNAEPALP